MDLELIQLMLIFGTIAMFYASAGFGGGSSYLAILTLFSLPFTSIRMIALLCNITVVSSSVLLLKKAGHLDIKRILPLILLSVPLAYIGGRFEIEEKTFFILLGFSLLFASMLMLFFNSNPKDQNTNKLPKYSNAIIGGGIGFLSGIVGIGGGIFLSPVLHLSKWGKVKTITATTATFILVNSIAGLIGQITSNGFTIDPTYAIALLVSVFIGGQFGIRLTINRLNPLTIKRVTALLILVVAVRILWQHLLS